MNSPYNSWKFVTALLLLTSIFTKVQPKLNKRVNFQPMGMSSEEVISYFRSFLHKVSSLDNRNEDHYNMHNFSDNLYHKIDNLIPLQTFTHWLMKTKEITDQTTFTGTSLLNEYQNNLNGKCNPSSIFKSSLPEILKSWDGDKTVAVNDLETWHKDNIKTPHNELCNRFHGLTCQYKLALEPDLDQGKTFEITNFTTCQCAGDPSQVGFFKASLHKNTSQNSYPDGCYFRPWKACNFLSMDPTFQQSYKEYHKSLENDRRILAQMVFPVGRPHRCKEGTYCVDIIPEMNRPTCVCESQSEDKACKSFATSGKSLPSAFKLMKIRKDFLKLIIPFNDSLTSCNPEVNDQVMKLMSSSVKDPSQTSTIHIMSELVSTEGTIKICDFRKLLICDKTSNICKGNLRCEEGKVHVGRGVCAINNGFNCASDEECVENGKCKYFSEAMQSACICEKGYGSECRFHKESFFAKRFLPIVSGYEGTEFLKMEVEIHRILESWEDQMRLKSEESCDPSGDPVSMALVNYFGSLSKFDRETGPAILEKAHQAIKNGGSRGICLYKRFLRCDEESRKCVPMQGKRIASSVTTASGKIQIVVEVGEDLECNLDIAKVFMGIVKFTCGRGYTCKKLINVQKCLPDCGSIFAPAKLCMDERNNGTGESVVKTSEKSTDGEEEGGSVN